MNNSGILVIFPYVNFDSLTKNKMMNENDAKLESELIDLFNKKIDLTNTHPFLIDPDTVQFIKNSQIMFINRGLPGSGKSTLSKNISNLYGQENTIICAGDDFFLDEYGNYNFDHEKLHQAHESAQLKARKACSESKSPIIIDNTNIRYWEIKPYLNIAKQFNYIILLIEPRTPHKFDLEKLFLLNKHNVPKKTIEQKLKDYQIIYPYYFALFLNQDNSHKVVNLAKQMFNNCLKYLDEFKSDLQAAKSTNDFNSLYELKNESYLHCTLKFVGNVKNEKFKSNLSTYGSKVADSMGKCFKMEIIGFSISNQSIAAVVSLNKDLLKLWDNDLNKDELNEVLKDNSLNEIENKNVLINDINRGERAHVTIGVKHGEKTMKSGLDLINIKFRMKLNKLKNYLNNSHDEITHETDSFYLFYLKDCFCFIKLKESLILDSIFTGYY